MQCPICHNNPPQTHPVFGILPCLLCQKRRDMNSLPDKPVEFAGESIKHERQEYGRSIIQPWRSGQLSKEYIEQHGTKNIKATPEEIKKAKYVWSDIYSRNYDLKKSK